MHFKQEFYRTRKLQRCVLSLQLWKAYLDERRREVRGLSIDNPRVKAVNNVFERALVNMHKMPRIWLDYLEFLVPQFMLTFTRRAFDRALCSLPITQHDRIWQLYLVRLCYLFIRQNEGREVSSQFGDRRACC